MTERQLNISITKYSKRNSGGFKRYPFNEIFEEDDQTWLVIPGFPGYRLSAEKGYVRYNSKANEKTNGVIVGYKMTSNGMVYLLKDYKGRDRTIGYDEILAIAQEEIISPFIFS